MKIERSYPKLKKRKNSFNVVQKIFLWLFLAAGITCLIVNYSVGGRKWCYVVIWSLWAIWNLILSPDLVEVNLISQTVKALFYVVIELLIIERCLVSGWAYFVIPIVCFSTQIFIAVIFFIDVNKGKSNSLPIIMLIFVTIVAFWAVYLFFRGVNWPMIVMFSISLVMSIIGFIAYRDDFKREFIKRFHTR